MRKLKLTKASIIGIFIVCIIGIGVVGALNGWFGGGGKIPEDTFTRGLVAYWSFDEGVGNTAYDISGNGNNGTLTNGPQWTRGKVGGALSFDGTDDYVEVPDSDSLDITDNLTIILWFKAYSWVDNKNYESVLVDKYRQYWVMFRNPGGIRFRIFDSSLILREVSTPANVLSLNTFYQVAVTFKKPVVRIFINGRLITEGTLDYNIVSTTNPVRLGTWTSTDNHFNGLIDEVRIYNRALSAEEIRYHYNRGGPVAYWKFDEGEGKVAFDSSDNNNSGHLHGPALSFDGTDDYVEVPSDSSLAITTVTLEAWINPVTWSSDTGWANIISHYTPGNKYELYLRDNGKISFFIRGSAETELLSDITVPTDQWSHIVAVFNPDTDFQGIYINGELHGSLTNTDTMTPATDVIRIGIRDDGSCKFNGIIDEVRIYNRALSATEVLEHYRGIYKDNTGLVGYWAFDENTGQTAYDSSGNGNNGTLGSTTSSDTNDPTWVNYAPSWTQGVYGSALSFDGTDDYVDAGNDASLDITDAITIEAWVKVNDWSYGGIVGKGGGDWNGWLFRINQINHVVEWIILDGSGNQTLSGNTQINLGQWYHVIATYDPSISSNNQKIFLNGNLDASRTYTGGLTSTTQPVNIGRYVGPAGNEEYFNGLIDEVRIYNYARTPEEIRLDYQAGVATHLGPKGKSCSEDPASCMDYGLVGYWSFDEGTGQTAYDSSGYNNNGTLGSSSGSDSSDPKWTKGKYGSALSFDGVNDYVEVPDDDSLDITNAITIEAWVKPNTLPFKAWTRIIKKTSDYAALTNGYGFRGVKNGSGIQLWVGNGTVSSNNVVSVTTGWNYIVMTYESGKGGNIYINGINRASLSDIGDIDPASGTNLRISESGSAFNGLIDEVRIYNRALSAEEIRYHYNRGAPVLNFKFDEGSGTTIYDSTENNNDGTLNLGTGGNTSVANAWVQGKHGTALSFDGVDDYVEVPDSSSLDITDAITIEAWVKSNDYTGNKDILTKYYYDWAFRQTWNGDGKFQFLLKIEGTVRSLSYNNPTYLWDGNWHHLVGSFDGVTRKIFVDGKEVASDSTYLGKITTSGSNLKLGYSDASTQYFNGLIDDVRIYNYARTPEQIRTDYNAGLATHFGPSDQGCSRDPASCMTKGLVGYWSFDEGAGSTVHDSSDYSNNGTLGGGTTSKMPKWTRGKHGSALSFDGTDDYVSVPDSSSLDITDAITIEAWVKPSDLSHGMRIVSRSGTTNTMGYVLQVGRVTNGVTLWLHNASSWQELSVSNVISTNEWWHIVATYDGNNRKIYVNGEVKGTGGSIGNIVGGSSPLDIGRRYDTTTEFFSGLIDEVRIYNRALSEEEIRYHYNRGRPVAYWKFDEGEGSVAYDSTDNNNDGTIYGATWVQGKYGSALSFDGVDDYVDMGDIARIRYPITLTAWVKLQDSTYTREQGVVFREGSWRLEAVTADSAPKWGFRLDNYDTGYHPEFTGSRALEINKWEFIAATYDGTKVRLYLNGVLDAEYSETMTPGLRNESLRIAHGIGALQNYFSGLIDDVRIYNYARTPEQIKMDYLGGAVRFK